MLIKSIKDLRIGDIVAPSSDRSYRSKLVRFVSENEILWINLKTGDESSVHYPDDDNWSDLWELDESSRMIRILESYE